MRTTELRAEFFEEPRFGEESRPHVARKLDQFGVKAS